MDDNPEVAAPHVSDGIGKNRLLAAEQTYRQYEKATENNAITAAEMAGVPVSEMSSLKITDMQTSLREGDLAVKPVENDVSKVMAQKPGVFGFQDRTGAAAFGQAAHTGLTPTGQKIAGDTPHAGAKANSVIRSFHERHAAAIVKSGEQGRH